MTESALLAGYFVFILNTGLRRVEINLHEAVCKQINFCNLCGLLNTKVRKTVVITCCGHSAIINDGSVHSHYQIWANILHWQEECAPRCIQ